MGEGDEGLAAFGVGIENDARQTVAGRFGQAHIAGNDGVKHPVAIVALELVAHLLLQGDARIEHDPQQADQAQIAIEIGVYELDGVGEIGQPLQREIFALHGHDHALGRAQAVEREQAQGGRAVDEDEVVIPAHRRQGVFQALFTLFKLNQLHLSARQLAIGAQHGIAAARLGQIGRAAHRFGHGDAADEHVIHAMRQAVLVHARSHRGIALRVHIHQQHALPDAGQPCGEIDGRGGFANAAFLVGDAEDAGHDENGARRMKTLAVLFGPPIFRQTHAHPKRSSPTALPFCATR